MGFLELPTDSPISGHWQVENEACVWWVMWADDWRRCDGCSWKGSNMRREEKKIMWKRREKNEEWRPQSWFKKIWESACIYFWYWETDDSWINQIWKSKWKWDYKNTKEKKMQCKHSFLFSLLTLVPNKSYVCVCFLLFTLSYWKHFDMCSLQQDLGYCKQQWTVSSWKQEHFQSWEHKIWVRITPE